VPAPGAGRLTGFHYKVRPAAKGRRQDL